MVRSGKSEPIAISETESELTLDARSAGENGLEAAGQLTTADRAGIDGQSITIRVDGDPVTTLETTDDGTYEGEVSLDHVDSPDERTDEVVAVYNDGGNIRDSQISTTVDVDIGEDADPGGLIAIVGVVFGSLLELLGVRTPDLDLSEQSFGLVH